MKVLYAVILLAISLVRSQAAESLNEGLLVYLPLTTGLEDASTNKVPVKAHGNVRIEEDGAYFAGGDDWLELPFLKLHQTPFSATMWLKVTGKDPMYGLLYQHDNGENNQWLHLMFRGGLQPYVGFYNNDAISPLPVEHGVWTHLALQYDGTSQQIWINNRLVCSRETGPYEGVAGLTYIGRSPNWNNVPSRNFQGFIREFRIYSRALQPIEIARLNGKEGNLAPLSLPDPALSNALAAQVGIPFLHIAANKITVTGESGQVYEVRGTSDLNSPLELLGYLTNSFGRVEFTDQEAPVGGQRFYSLKLKEN
ncbi:MAG: LamG domain-containing protein [Verrucomicrobiales bacterium]